MASTADRRAAPDRYRPARASRTRLAQLSLITLACAGLVACGGGNDDSSDYIDALAELSCTTAMIAAAPPADATLKTEGFQFSIPGMTRPIPYKASNANCPDAAPTPPSPTIASPWHKQVDPETEPDGFDSRTETLRDVGTIQASTDSSELWQGQEVPLDGLLRAGEITDSSHVGARIEHAIAIGIPASLLSDQFVAPATAADPAGNATGSIALGTHFAIENSADFDSMGMSPNMLRLATALQEYGAVVIGASGTDHIVVYADDDAQADVDALNGSHAVELQLLLGFLSIIR